MCLCRNAYARSAPRVVPLQRPFSNLAYIDQAYAQGHSASLRRTFSQARSLGCKTLVVEDIQAAGAVAEERHALTALDACYSSPTLQRLTFWTSQSPDGVGLPPLASRFLAGYAIVKRDVLPGRSIDRFHL